MHNNDIMKGLSYIQEISENIRGLRLEIFVRGIPEMSIRGT
jgi:hypothetical protein